MAAAAAPSDVHIRICHNELVKCDLEIKAAIQDIQDCPGPMSRLNELNTNMKEKFHQQLLKLQPVRWNRITTNEVLLQY